MAMRRRSDGILVDDLPPLRKVVPYLMRGRTESTVFFPQRIEVDELLAWLDVQNASRSHEERITLFHVVLTAIARALRLRPELNRFVAGRRTYQHRDISISFVVKAALTDEAPDREARLVFTGHETVVEVRDMVSAAVHRERGEERGGDDKLIDFFASWPRPVLNAVSSAITRLDYHNALPAALRRAIPLYTSVYVVNTGSIGVEAPFHHLYEWGSASIFVSLGRLARQPVVDADGRVAVRSCLDLVYTLDERASDGFYFARTAEVFRRLVAEPAMLADPEVTVDDLVPQWPPHG